MTDLEEKAYEVLRRNSVEGEGFAYTRPGGRYKHQFFWDSCFHAMVLRHFDTAFAKKELFALFQFQEPSGFVPHLSYHFDQWEAQLFWGRPHSSGLIQPPIVAEAVWAVYEIDPDKQFLQEIYPKLAAFYRFLLTVRDHDQDGLFSYVHPWESGWDQSIEWEFAFRGRQWLTKQWRTRFWLMTLPYRRVDWDQKIMMEQSRFHVETVDGNSLLSVNLAYLTKIADALGKRGEAGEWREGARSVERAVLSALWDGETFSDHYLVKGVHDVIRKRTPVMFFPLLLPSLSKDQKKKLIDTLVGEFLTVSWPIPTAAPAEPHFNPEAYWRGTTWMNVNYYVIRGLLQQGEKELAKDLIELSVRLVARSGFREYYNPFTGEGMGAHDFSWSSLVVDLLKRVK